MAAIAFQLLRQEFTIADADAPALIPPTKRRAGLGHVGDWHIAPFAAARQVGRSLKKRADALMGAHVRMRRTTTAR
jgi:hypothetical protein